MSEQRRNRTRTLISRTQALAGAAVSSARNRSQQARATMLVMALGVSASVSAAPTTSHVLAASAAKPEAQSKPAKRHWFEVGKATWYGEEFDGRKTANGETFDSTEFTAAHRTLPLGSLIRVTNLRNKRSMVVRVTDRGPWVNNAMLDLSHAAAQKLGFNGTAKVKIEPVDKYGRILQEVAQLTPEKSGRIDE